MATRVRPPAVAGAFYPDDPGTLAALVGELLGEAARRVGQAPPVRALVAPHAGYVYSGPIAASSFARLHRGVRRVVLLGPAHRVPVRGLALPDADALATPLGELAVDQELAAAIVDLPQVTVAASAHAWEHSLEVELPFLQTLLEQPRVLPLVVGDAAPAAIVEVLDATALADDTAVVVSSDLSHYLAYEEARAIDTATAAQVVRLEPTLTHEQACGATPLNGFLAWARERDLRAELLDLRSSGDTAGDRSRVVGYGAFAFA
jgi:AmmeMemoRadiSam system protein B